MDIEKELFNTWKDNGHLQTVSIYLAHETPDDPGEGTVTREFLNPIHVDALVMDYKPESLRWKFVGTLPIGSKQLICKRRYENLFKLAAKIKIGNDYFKTYRDDMQGFGLLKREDYLVVILSYKGIGIND